MHGARIDRRPQRPARAAASALVAALAGALLPASAPADGGRVCASRAAGSLVVTLFTAPVPLRVGPADLSVLVQDRTSRSALLDATVHLQLEPARRSDPTTASAPAHEQRAAHDAASHRAPGWADPVQISPGRMGPGQAEAREHPSSAPAAPEEHLGAAHRAPIEVTASSAQATNRLLQAALVDLPSPGVWHLRATVRHGAQTAELGCVVDVVPAAPPLLSLWPQLALPPVAIALFALHQWRKSRARRPLRER